MGLGKALETFYCNGYAADPRGIDTDPFERAVAVAPGSYLALDLLGWARYRRLDLPAAREAFTAALEKNPHGVGVLNGLLRCAVQTGDEAGAYRWAEAIATLRGGDGDAQKAAAAQLLAKNALGRGDARAAAALYRKATAWAPTRKLYADGKGRETEASLDEAFDVGVFAAEPGRKEFTAESVLALERRPLKSGRQTVTLVVDREPNFVGVDPYNKRIDRNSDDNLARVDVDPGEPALVATPQADRHLTGDVPAESCDAQDLGHALPIVFHGRDGLSDGGQQSSSRQRLVPWTKSFTGASSSMPLFSPFSQRSYLESKLENSTDRSNAAMAAVRISRTESRCCAGFCTACVPSSA